jgi:hypothetical protein
MIVELLEFLLIVAIAASIPALMIYSGLQLLLP